MSDSSAPTERLVSAAAGRQAWTKQAYEVLVETATRYNAVVTYTDLAEEVQRRSGLRTNASTRTWMPSILNLVAYQCHRLGDPALTALVIHKADGRVGNAYNEVLHLAGLPPIDDDDEREQHAATARLECYRRWGADVPPDATPTLPTRPAAGHRGTGERDARASGVRGSGSQPRDDSLTTTHGAEGSGGASRAGSRSGATPRRATSRSTTEVRRGAVCPTCFMEMPLSGACPNCS